MKNLSGRLDKIETKMLILFKEKSIEKRMSWALPLAREFNEKSERVFSDLIRKHCNVPPGAVFAPMLTEEDIQREALRLAKTYRTREDAELGEKKQGIERVRKYRETPIFSRDFENERIITPA